MTLLASPLLYVSQTPIATKCYTAIILIFSLFHAYLQYTTIKELSTPYLTLIPGQSIWYPWSFLTAGLIETNGLELLLSLVFLPSTLRYFERLWGAYETTKFILICTVIPNILAFIMNWLEFVVTGAELFLYKQQYAGQMALQASILVAFTQVIPEHQLQLFGSLKLRVKQLPMHYVFLSTAMCILGLQAPFVLIQFGWLVSWAYLRFYKRSTSETPGGVDTYGDRSEAFAFVHWFPSFLHYPIGALSDCVYRLALRFKLIKPPSASAADLESGHNLVPGGARAEAERRRALALKALDQRLAHNQASAVQPSSPPMEETSRVLNVPAPTDNVARSLPSSSTVAQQSTNNT